MPNEVKPLSDFWRRDRSNELVQELLNVFDFAMGYMGFFGLEYSVSWWGYGKPAGEAFSKKQVVLDYAPLKDKTPPFDGKDIDTVMGKAIQESGHLKWGYPPSKLEDYVADKLGKPHSSTQRPTFEGYEIDKYTELKVISDIVEDFYIENKISKKHPTLGAYLRESRPLIVNPEVDPQLLYNLTLDRPPWSNIVAMWELIILASKAIPDNASATSKKYLNELLNLTARLTKPAAQKTRLDITYKIWEVLDSLHNPDYMGMFQDDSHGHRHQHDDMDHLPEELKDKVDELVKIRLEDMGKIKKTMGAPAGKRLSIELARPNPSFTQKLYLQTLETATKVRQVFEADKRLRARHRRALLEGAVDRRRVYKAGAMDYKFFEKIDLIKPPSLAVGVLVDISGSMLYPAIIDEEQYKYIKQIKLARQRSMNEAQVEDALRTAMAFRTGLSKIENIEFMITAYSGTVNGTTLYRIFDKKTGDYFRPGVDTGGPTPSGTAISAMASEMDNYTKGKEKLIIHITDGAPASYEEVTKAVDFCKDKGIDVLTLTLSTFDKEVIRAYRGLVEFISDEIDLPKAMALLLFKKRMRTYH